MEIQKIWFDENSIFLRTKQGVEQSLPLKWFPKLENASVIEKENYELSPFGIHWESIDEDLSFEGFFEFKASEKQRT
ncbi:DUF2442 domain-containing protein [uncultured Polaribacter sp.]|uniref:DUF2442 domain-containing protein n=1 Tax=uncultured Polaribacter sp. TaxID=174711 RepID=UPI00260721A1|nr:DUF2442 domain-containing protein [uncultured Polaribacter sp.]